MQALDRAPDAEERAILEISSPNPDAAATGRALAACTSTSKLFELATLHNLLPQLVVQHANGAWEHSRLAALAPSFLLLDRLQIITLHEIKETLDQAGIPFMVLKGHGLAETLYANPLERLSADVDVLVPRTARTDAIKVLHDRGYEPIRLEFYERTHFHVPLLRRDLKPPITVEVHWDLSPPNSPIRFEPDRWWADARSVRLRAGEVLVPSREHTLAHLAWHAFNKGAVTLRDLGDIVRLWCSIRRENAEDAALRHCAQVGVGSFLEESLRLSAAFWPPSAPALPWSDLPAEKRWLARRLLAPGAVLQAGKRRELSYRKICYWSLLDPRQAPFTFLLRDTLEDVANQALADGRSATWREKASALADLLLAVSLCSLPMAPPDQPRSAS